MLNNVSLMNVPHCRPVKCTLKLAIHVSYGYSLKSRCSLLVTELLIHNCEFVLIRFYEKTTTTTDGEGFVDCQTTTIGTFYMSGETEIQERNQLS